MRQSVYLEYYLRWTASTIDQDSSSSDLVRILDPFLPRKGSTFHRPTGSPYSELRSRPCPLRNHERNNSCIRLEYKRYIMLTMYLSPELPRLSLPSHQWFHEIRRESYLYKGPPCVAETCHDPSCRNYYSMAKTSSHPEVILSRPPRWSMWGSL